MIQSDQSRYRKRSPELRAEVERLLEKDDTVAGDVYRTLKAGGTLEDHLRSNPQRETTAHNQPRYLLRVLLEGLYALAAVHPSGARGICGRVFA